MDTFSNVVNGLDGLIWSMVLVLGIEFFQLFSAFGAFDVDDILLNCLGASLGFGCYKLYSLIQRRGCSWKDS